MNIGSYKQSHIFSIIMLILILSIMSSTAFGLTICNTTLEEGYSDIAASPAVARFGLDGPSPRDVQYSPLDAIGTYNLIVILVEFTDETHYFSSSQVETNALTALNDYYNEVSYGLVQVDGDTTPWLDLGQNRANYVDGTVYPSDPKFDLLEDAVALADSIVDFSSYNGVTIIHAGQGQELSHDPLDYWSSEWFSSGGSPILMTNEGPIYRASVSPEESTPGQPSYVGVLAHEFGHDLGLPDLYDIDYEEEFVGHWGLMGAGSWNGPMGVGEEPAHIMGYGKAKLGWINGSRLVDVISDLTTVIEPLEIVTTGVQLVRINITSEQYFLIEVRRRIGYDASLPGSGAGSEGVLVTYVDETIESGHGIVKVIDAHPGGFSPTVDDGAFGIGPGHVDSYVSSLGQFSMVVEDEVGQGYNVSIIRAFMEFLTPRDGSAVLSSDVTIEWNGTALGGIDHYELYLDGTLNYTGLGTSLPVTGLTSGLHNATLIMELAATGRRLRIESQFVVDLAPPVISTVSHSPEAPGFGDIITISLDATDDTWIVNATIYYQRQGDTRWYHIDMTLFTGTEWRGILGTFLPGVVVSYYVTVTDAGNRTVTDNNAGSNYSFTIAGLGLMIWLIIAAAAILIIVLLVCMRLQHRRGQEINGYVPPSAPRPLGTPLIDSSKKSSDTTASSPKPEQTYCYHCGAPLTPNSIYCGHCGRPVE
jgi:M6 family metalloprotease-like protein